MRLLQEEEDRQRREEEERERQRLEKQRIEKEKAERRRQREEAAEEERRRVGEERRAREREEAERVRLEEEEEKMRRKEERRKQKKLEKQREQEREREELEKQREQERERVLQQHREELKKQREQESQRAMQQHREELATTSAGKHDEAELSLDDVFRPQSSPGRTPGKLDRSWGGFVSPNGTKYKLQDVGSVPDGLVAKIVNEHGKNQNSPSNIYSPRIQQELNKSIGKGLVAQRLAQAKANEKSGVPSLFSFY